MKLTEKVSCYKDMWIVQDEFILFDTIWNDITELLVIVSFEYMNV